MHSYKTKGRLFPSLVHLTSTDDRKNTDLFRPYSHIDSSNIYIFIQTSNFAFILCSLFQISNIYLKSIKRKL